MPICATCTRRVIVATPSSSTEARARLPTSASSIAWSSCRIAWSSASSAVGRRARPPEGGAQRPRRASAPGSPPPSRRSSRGSPRRRARGTRPSPSGRPRAGRPGAGGRPRSAPGPRARSCDRPPASPARPCRSPGAASTPRGPSPSSSNGERAPIACVGGSRRSQATRWKPFSAFPSTRRTTLPAASFTVSTTTGFGLAALRLDLRPARERRVLPGLDERLLLLLPAPSRGCGRRRPGGR